MINIVTKTYKISNFLKHDGVANVCIKLGSLQTLALVLSTTELSKWLTSCLTDVKGQEKYVPFYKKKNLARFLEHEIF